MGKINERMSETFEYWSEAVKLVDELVVSNAEEKILSFLKDKKLNLAEAALLKEYLKDAFELKALMKTFLFYDPNETEEE